jgi:hypothetical protein
MPTVVNNGTGVKFWNERAFRLGQIMRVNFFIPPDLGLTVISEEPRVPPRCLASGEIEVQGGASAEIAVPFCTSFRASFVCLSGAVYIRQNYADAEAVYVTPELEYEIHYRRADVEKIIIAGVADARVVYDIERVM